MEQKAEKELMHLFQDALKIGGAPIEMRLRRFVSLVRSSDPGLAETTSPLIAGSTGSLRGLSIGTHQPVDADSKQQLLKSEYPAKTPRSPVLDINAKLVVDRVLQERRAGEQLAAAGLVPIRSMLISGPPGVGKTLTASWMAQQLDLPLLTLDLATVMSSFLGKTGNNIRTALEFAQQRPCVLLLDEFDAIAKRRGDEGDVGELKRLVTVLLQAVDEWQPNSLLIAATNHPELLDPAIWRRFDVTLHLGLPDYSQRCLLLEAMGVDQALAKAVAALAAGQSLSFLDRAVASAKKAQVLGAQSFERALLEWISPHILSTATTGSDGVSKRDLEVYLLHYQGQTAREIAERFGVSHTTVVRTIKKLRERGDGRT